MSSPARHVVWIDDDDATDASLTGTKFARLAELRRWPESVRPVVPEGFALSTEAYRLVAAHNGLDSSTPSEQQLRESTVPAALRAQLDDALALLQRRTGSVAWAVRSSSPTEDGPTASYAGQFNSVLGVRGAHQVLDAYLSCCASAAADGLGEYRRRMGSDGHHQDQTAVIVQPMVHEGDGITGVVFSEHPVEADAVLIEAVRGPGDLLGQVIPDRYVVRPGDDRTDVDRPANATMPDRIVEALAHWALTAQHRLGVAVDVEFALDRAGSVHILQLRPITPGAVPEHHVAAPVETTAVTGLAVGTGRVEGPVCRIDGPEQAELVTDGCVLVTQSTDPRWLPLLGRVSAVVTDHGGLTSHAAIVCRELGLLAVVGCGDATRGLRHGQRVVVTAATTGRGSVEEVDES